MAASLFSQEHSGTDLAFAVVVRGGDVRVVQEQQPLVAVFSQVFGQALHVGVSAVAAGQPVVEVPFDPRSSASTWTPPTRRAARRYRARFSAA